VTASDDPSVREDDDLAYRRVHPRQLVKAVDGRPRVSSATFKPNRQDELALSVYLRSVLTDLSVSPADCIPAGGQHMLAALDVGDLRRLGHGVIRDPVTDARIPNQCDPAHALITGFQDGRKAMDRQARALAETARWPI